MRTLVSALLLLAGPAGAAETVVQFDASRGETPESIQFDRHGDMYVSLALTGEVRKIAPDGAQTALAFLPIAPEVQPCGNAFGLPIMGGVALDPQGNAYVSVASCDTAQIGVWKVAPDGETTHIGPLPANAVPNGIAYHAGHLYVADTNLGAVWRVDADGEEAPAIWAQDPLLAPLPDFFPGPNGLQIFRGEVYVSVSDSGRIVAFPLSGGAPRVHAEGVMLDDFAFDVRGNLYGTTDPFNTLVRVAPDGSADVLLTAADGLDGPTAAAFDGDAIYITNGAFPFFSTTRRPSIMRLDVGIRGARR
jgi:sugar lactone lactonase YvrE